MTRAADLATDARPAAGETAKRPVGRRARRPTGRFDW